MIRVIRAVAWRTVCLTAGLLFVIGVLSFTGTLPARGNCPVDNQGCASYAQQMVTKFRHHQIGDSGGFEFPSKFQQAFDRAARRWEQAHHHKGFDPLKPIKDMVHEGTHQLACGLNTLTHCQETPSPGTDQYQQLYNSYKQAMNITIACAGGSFIASLKEPPPLGYNPWIWGTGTAGCTFSMVWMETHGH